jgi:hypothetical protein
MGFTHPELFDLALFVVLEFIHILLELLYLCPRGCLLLLRYRYAFMEIFDSLLSCLDIIFHLCVVDQGN